MTNSESRVAIYPGSFDPLTNGHVDIIERGSRIFDSIIVAILANVEKTPLFSEKERIEILRDVFKDRANVKVETFNGLLVDYAKQKEAHVIVRGLRAVSDFEYEFQMAGMNRNLFPEVEPLFLTPSEQYTFISATIVREIAKFGGDVSSFVHPAVLARLKAKFSKC